MALQTILQTWFGGDIKRLNKVLLRYLQCNLLNRELLEQAFLSNDRVVLAQIAHKMRGSAAQMRMDQYAAVLHLIELNHLSSATSLAGLMQQEEAEWLILSETCKNWLQQSSSQDEQSDVSQSGTKLDR